MRIVVLLCVLFLLSGCGSIGKRGVYAAGEYSEGGQLLACVFKYESGSDISDRFDADIGLISGGDNCSITVAGTGGATAVSPGIRATGDAVTSVTEAVSEGVVNGVRRGFVPVMP